MKKLLLMSLFIFHLQICWSQKLFQSTHEVGKKQFNPSQTFKQKVADISKRPIGTEKEEFDGIYDKDFYQLQNGFIAYGPDVYYMHYRLIFDKNENWIETQELFHSDVLPEEPYYQIMPKMIAASAKKYLIEYFANFIKITNVQGFWYEIEASKKNKKVWLIFDKDIKLIGERK